MEYFTKLKEQGRRLGRYHKLYSTTAFFRRRDIIFQDVQFLAGVQGIWTVEGSPMARRCSYAGDDPPVQRMPTGRPG